MSSFPPRLPDDLKERAAAQDEAAGVSLDQHIATTITARVGAQAEAKRYFAAPSRVQPGRAREILAHAGQERAPAKGGEVGSLPGTISDGNVGYRASEAPAG